MAKHLDSFFLIGYVRVSHFDAYYSFKSLFENKTNF